MATPRLRHGFVAIMRYSPRLRDVLKNAKPITNIFADLAIIGSVAVDLKGNRIGKGGGYVHDLQVFEDISYLMEPHDEKVNFIVTPTRVISCDS